MRIAKKIISILLCLIMTSGFALTVLASSVEYDHLPQIFVSGIGSKKVYHKDDPEKNSLFYPINTDKMIADLKDLPGYAMDSIKNLDPRILYNCVYNWAYGIFGDAALLGDGFSSKENVTIDPPRLNYDGDGKYTFNYDSRLDPVDLARELDEYIGWVQEDSGSQKVELVGSSYGTSIIVAYLNEYKEKRDIIDSVVLCVPSVGGVDLVGELFTGSFTLNPDTLEQFIDGFVGNDDIALLLSVLNKSGALDYLIKCFLDPALRIALLDAVRAIVHDIVGTCPAMWTFVQDEYFYDAVEHIYGENYNDEDHEYAGLIDRITYYHDNIMVKASEIIKDAEAEGVKMNVICKYGRPAVPLSEHGNFRSDGAVGVSVASFGAVATLRDEYFPEDYVQKLYPGYDFVSPDRCIDASTCILPFNTWFIKGLEHSEKPDAYHEMVNTILYEDLDIFSDERYPQFMQTSPETNDILIPTMPAEIEKDVPLLLEVIKLMIRVVDILIENIRNFFGM